MPVDYFHCYSSLLEETSVEFDFCFSSELNLRIWQQSRQMFEQTGQRPVVYNNQCGQMFNVS